MISTSFPDELARFRRALGSFLTGVTVITTRDAQGRDRGLTVNSFTSVSLDPPLVLFCIDRGAASCAAFMGASGYVVHVLGSHQQDLAKVFASKSPDKFAGLQVGRSSTGVAILADAHAVLDCAAYEVVEVGDHAVIIARVEAFEIADQRPLGFYQGAMRSFHTENESARSATAGVARLAVVWLVEMLDGEIVLRCDRGRTVLPFSVVSTGELDGARLAKVATATLGAPVAIEFLYSVYGSPSDALTLVYRGRVHPSAEHGALAAGHVLMAAGEAALLVSDDTERSVLERYVAERGDLRFGIYAGSDETGSVATLAVTSAVARLSEGR
ncbi:flavin reductase family protein [Mycolicibacterium sp. BiH015]|nr:flavin reductase family protein [Mycolicibacterium sp. BiH015]MDA2893316.1 flavin reductase family protein [Mycolicibacterium sp. BiH015]